MRCDQYIGLNEWASAVVSKKESVREIGVRLSVSGSADRSYDMEPFDREITVPVAKTEVIGQIQGAFDDVVANLTRYTMPDGKVYEEFVQAEPWSSGPCYFIALRDGDGMVVPESLWLDEEIDNA